MKPVMFPLSARSLCALCVLVFLCSVFSIAQTSKPRIAVLAEKGFPTIDGLNLSESDIRQALTGYNPRFLSTQSIISELESGKFDLAITPYGSAFPEEAANALFAFLRSGGHWLNLGGAPLSVPVTRENGKWKIEERQTAYHKTLGITQPFRVSSMEFRVKKENLEINGVDQLAKEISPEEVYELYVRFTSTKDFPTEDGTAGQRDAILRPLIWEMSDNGTKLAAPIVAIDQLQGEFAGGRWVLANFKGTLSQKGLRWIVDHALNNAASLTVRPSFACYREGEVPSFSVQLQQPAGRILLSDKCALVLTDTSGKELERTSVSLVGVGPIATGTVTSGLGRLKPGLYRVTARQSLRGPGSSLDVVQSTNGFWIYDDVLMNGGPTLTTNDTYLLRNGEPYPVTGTTYMASDVARKFLFEPNPSVWDKDFAAMKEAGINMVRTGLWTGWKNIMLDVGAFNEATLRSLDAFLLTARKYDIPVIFTFFAFIPETWGGVNAYLDPRSVNAQQQFLGGIAQRYGKVNDVIWDLINEPTFCNPNALWSCRPNYDQFEAAAWTEWLRRRNESLPLAWRMTTEESRSLPRFEEFSDLNIFDQRRPLRVVQYRLFAQEMFRQWIGDMTNALRSNGNTHQLITVGQDEGGTNDSPNNLFMGDALGFTSMHNWWLNDDLVWDNVITKMPGVPNLLEETGVMFYEKMDGSAWRTEDEAAALLERKLAISMGAGGAGFIEWIWNINPYMKSDNEATIGLFRVDGTAKPELRPVAEYARFFNENKSRMKGREAEDVVLVIPHSNMFSTRNFATEATKRAVRALSGRMGIPVASVSEYGIARLNRTPKLLILPSPRVLTEASWQALLSLVRKGSTLLVSGPIDFDEHWLPQSRLGLFGVKAGLKPVAAIESVSIGGHEASLEYRGLKFQRLEKAVSENALETKSWKLEKGLVLWCPLPIENADNIEPTAIWYEFGLKQAGVRSPFSLQAGTTGLLVLATVFEENILLACVSETDGDVATKITVAGTPIAVTVPSQRTVLLFVDRTSGSVTARLGM